MTGSSSFPSLPAPDRRDQILTRGHLLWQTPLVFDLAKPCKHSFVFFANSIPFRYAAKLDHVSMRAMQYEKRVRRIRPAPMLAEVKQLLGRWGCRTDFSVRYIRGVVHHVRDVGSRYVLRFIGIHVSPKN